MLITCSNTADKNIQQTLICALGHHDLAPTRYSAQCPTSSHRTSSRGTAAGCVLGTGGVSVALLFLGLPTSFVTLLPLTRPSAIALTNSQVVVPEHSFDLHGGDTKAMHLFLICQSSGKEFSGAISTCQQGRHHPLIRCIP